MRDDSLERGPAERTRASENRPTGKKGVTNGGIKLVKDDEKCRKKAPRRGTTAPTRRLPHKTVVDVVS